MLSIRPEQLVALDAAADARLAGEVAAHLSEEYADAIRGTSSEELRRRVTASIALAREHGLTSARTLGSFVVLRFVVGPSFHRHPAVRSVLAQGERGFDALTALDAEVWQEARGNDDGAW